MPVTAIHTNACFNAWIKCENLLYNIAEVKDNLSRKVTKVIDECALICMGTFYALKTSSVNSRRMALLCVGICEECAELCESLHSDKFLECARICRECSETMSRIAFTENQ